MRCRVVGGMLVIVLTVAVLSGCQGYRQFVTTGSNAFRPIKMEVAPEVQAVAKIEDMQVERKAQAGASFVFSGNIVYDRSCNAALMLDVDFVSTDAVVLRSIRAPLRSYVANTKARFMASAYINAHIGESKDIIDKVVIRGLSCV